MAYSIVLRASAKKEITKLPKKTYSVVRDAIDGLAAEPRPRQSKKLVGGKNSWRLRIGDYRVVYEIYDKQLFVEVIRIRHRKDAYKR